VIVYAGFVPRVLFGGHLASVLEKGPLGYLSVVEMLVTITAGPFAVVQLVRLRRSGWIAALIFWGTLATYFVLALTVLRPPSILVGTSVRTPLWGSLLVAVLCLPAIRRASLQSSYGAH